MRTGTGLVAIVWMLLTVPRPAVPYILAFIGVVGVWAAWKVKREGPGHDGVNCRCKWCKKQEKQEEEGR
jgi:xanthosine utilization system XapX-like protein